MTPARLAELLYAASALRQLLPEDQRAAFDALVSELVDALGRAKDSALAWRRRCRDLAAECAGELSPGRLCELEARSIPMEWRDRLPGGALRE